MLPKNGNFLYEKVGNISLARKIRKMKVTTFFRALSEVYIQRFGDVFFLLRKSKHLTSGRSLLFLILVSFSHSCFFPITVSLRKTSRSVHRISFVFPQHNKRMF